MAIVGTPDVGYALYADVDSGATAWEEDVCGWTVAWSRAKRGRRGARQRMIR